MSDTDHLDDLGRAGIIAEARETVADQLHDMIVERVTLGSGDGVADRVRDVGNASRRVREARGRQRQHVEMGLPVSQPLADEQDAVQTLRSAVARLAEECGAWLVTLDSDPARRT